MSVPLYPVLCSSVLLLCWVLCAWEEVTARWSQWGSWSPLPIRSVAVCFRKRCVYTTPAVKSCGQLMVSAPNTRYFQFFCLPSLPPVQSQRRIEGQSLGYVLWNAQCCSLSRISPVMLAVWAVEPHEQSSVFVCCARSWSAAVPVLCVRVAARVGMCVFVCLRLGA